MRILDDGWYTLGTSENDYHFRFTGWVQGPPDPMGPFIGDDYNHDDAASDPTRHGSKVIWIRDEANRTYRRNIESKERKGPVVFDQDSMTLRIDFSNL